MSGTTATCVRGTTGRLTRQQDSTVERQRLRRQGSARAARPQRPRAWRQAVLNEHPPGPSTQSGVYNAGPFAPPDSAASLVELSSAATRFVISLACVVSNPCAPVPAASCECLLEGGQVLYLRRIRNFERMLQFVCEQCREFVRGAAELVELDDNPPKAGRGRCPQEASAKAPLATRESHVDHDVRPAEPAREVPKRAGSFHPSRHQCSDSGRLRPKRT